MRNRALLFGLLGVFAAGTAWAIATSTLRTEYGPWLFKGKVGIEFGANKTYDFPELGGPTFADNTVCAYSSAAVVKGLEFGDVCSVGVDQVMPSAFGSLDVQVTAANTAKVRLCAVGLTDGGVFDMPDASYAIRCFKPTTP